MNKCVRSMGSPRKSWILTKPLCVSYQSQAWNQCRGVTTQRNSSTTTATCWSTVGAMTWHTRRTTMGWNLRCASTTYYFTICSSLSGQQCVKWAVGRREDGMPRYSTQRRAVNCSCSVGHLLAAQWREKCSVASLIKTKYMIWRKTTWKWLKK